MRMSPYTHPCSNKRFDLEQQWLVQIARFAIVIFERTQVRQMSSISEVPRQFGEPTSQTIRGSLYCWLHVGLLRTSRRFSVFTFGGGHFTTLSHIRDFITRRRCSRQVRPAPQLISATGGSWRSATLYSHYLYPGRCQYDGPGLSIGLISALKKTQSRLLCDFNKIAQTNLHQALRDSSQCSHVRMCHYKLLEASIGQHAYRR